MKKILLIVALVSFFVPSMAFSAKTYEDGSTLGANSEKLSLSPNVELSYDSDDGESYALTGGSQKGNMSYGVEAGNQVVYQKAKDLGENKVETADDDDDLDAVTYGDGWSSVGK